MELYEWGEIVGLISYVREQHEVGGVGWLFLGLTVLFYGGYVAAHYVSVHGKNSIAQGSAVQRMNVPVPASFSLESMCDNEVCPLTRPLVPFSSSVNLDSVDLKREGENVFHKDNPYQKL